MKKYCKCQSPMVKNSYDSAACCRFIPTQKFKIKRFRLVSSPAHEAKEEIRNTVSGHTSVHSTTKYPILPTPMPLTENQIGSTLIGRIDRIFVPRRFGFIIPHGHEDSEVFFRFQDYVRDGRIYLSTVVEFDLYQNHKGWYASEVRNHVPLITSRTISTNANTAKQAPAQGNGSVPPYEWVNRAPKVSNEASNPQVRTMIERHEESLKFYHGMKTMQNNKHPMAHLTAEVYLSSFDEYVHQFVEESMFNGFFDVEENILKMRRSWLELKEFASDHLIPLADILDHISSFHDVFISCKASFYTHRFFDYFSMLIKYFDAHIAHNEQLSAWSKAAWILVHTAFNQCICPESVLNALLLANFVLIRGGVPFPLSFDFANMTPQQDEKFREALENDKDERKMSIWVLEALDQQWLKFHECYSLRLQSVHVGNSHSLNSKDNKADSKKTSAEQKIEDRDKIIALYREELKNERVCFICMDDQIKPTVSLLCCGQVTHVHCVSRWHKTQYRQYNSLPGQETCPNCRQSSVEPLISSETAGVRPLPPAFGLNIYDLLYHSPRRLAPGNRTSNAAAPIAHVINFADDDTYSDYSEDDEGEFYEDESYQSRRSVLICGHCDHRQGAVMCVHQFCSICCQQIGEVCERHQVGW